MSAGPFLNIKAPRKLLDRLDDYRFAQRKPSRAQAARELLDKALQVFFEARCEGVAPGDPDYTLVRARRREPVEPLPIRDIEMRIAKLKRARSR